MKDDANVRKLAELIFSKQVETSTEMTAPNLSIPTCLLTNDLYRKIQYILRMHKMIFDRLGRKFIVECSNTMMSSYNMYVKGFMFNCLRELKCYKNIFESFFSMCALLRLINNEILNKTGTDFRDLNMYAFIVFYDNAMKKEFCEHGGFRRLLEFISDHRCLTWKWNELVSTEHSTCSIIQEDIRKEIKKELSRRHFFTSVAETEAMFASSRSLADLVLSTMSVEFPILTSNSNMFKCLVVPRKIEETKSARTIKTETRLESLDGTCPESLNSNSESKINRGINPITENVRYENIIQAVIRHNHSKSSSPTNSGNQIQKEAVGILGHLEDMIKSFITVLDEYNKN